MGMKSERSGRSHNQASRSFEQGDIVLINFGNRCEGSRHLYGKRLGYVIGRHGDDNKAGVLLVVPLFRGKSRDGAENDVEIRPSDCRGLRYTEYAQVMNLQKIGTYQVIRRIGRVKKGSIHAELLASMWEQVEWKNGRK